jgi:cytochrome c oxidase subunit II
MKTKVLFIFSSVLILALMEGIAWMVFKSSKENRNDLAQVEQEAQAVQRTQEPVNSVPMPADQKDAKSASVSEPTNPVSLSGLSNKNFDSFPSPSTEVVNGRTERTIHIGVRRYVWEPATITAKQGELVRLIVHNADVKHGLVIPDLGVNQDIPEEGAVAEFVAKKQGTFEFFCSVWCGEGHMEMRGKIIIE